MSFPAEPTAPETVPAAAPETATPESAPAQSPQTSTDDMSIEEIAAGFRSGNLGPGEGGGSPEASTPAEGEQSQEEASDPWEAKAPKPKPKSITDRLAARREAEARAKTAAEYEARVAELEAERQRLTADQSRADAEFRRLIAAGKLDDALKVKGVSLTFQQLQEAELRRLGALKGGGADPRVDELRAELAALKSEREKSIERYRQQQAEAERQRQFDEDRAAVVEELAGLGLPGADRFAKAPGVAETVLHMMAQDPQLTTEQAAASARQHFAALYTALHDVFGETAAPVTQRTQSPAAAAPGRTIAPGAAPSSRVPDDLPAAEHYEEVKRQMRALGLL